jgi:hypothetical protein
MVFSWDSRRWIVWAIAKKCDRFFLQSRRSLSHEVADSHAKFSRTAVHSSGTLGKGRKQRFTVDGGFLSRLLFLD